MGEYMGAVPFVLKMTSFVEKLSAEALAHFNDVTQKPFSQQAVAFLNAYWPEVHDQAEFIFTVAWEVMKYADMHAKGIQLIFQYEEGNDLDFDIGLSSTNNFANLLNNQRMLNGLMLNSQDLNQP